MMSINEILKMIDSGDDDDEKVKDNGRIDTVPKKYTLLDKYGKLIEENMPKDETKLFRHIANYRNANIGSLETPYFVNYPPWNRDDDEGVLWKILHVTASEADKDFANIERPSFYRVAKYNIYAFHVILLLVIRYYLKLKKMDKVYMLYFYYGYSIYWMAYTRSFPDFKPSREVVTYTVNNLTYRFKLKKVGSINNMLFYLIAKVLKGYQARLLNASDYELLYIADQLRSRIGNYVNTLADLIYANAKSKNYMLQGNEFDGEGKTRVATSVTTNTSMMADRKTTEFFSNPPREDIINRIVSMRRVDKNEIRAVITYLIDHRKFYDDVRKFYEALFTVYLQSDGASLENIHSLNFIAEMEKVYRKGNTLDENILTIREILDDWLSVASSLYKNAARLTLKNDYRKAIFYYFVFEIASNK